jgi:hypothetical protein
VGPEKTSSTRRISMRAEIETVVSDIKQSMELLRRHL